ncbi:hypothetical protein PAXRUDRAFT_156996 [Paxillus rubicundulus Ve08.2h10]|uniref:Uncharacterized protein n=1 Tax=Paxillus rubicundulus Ve08.2h10 TaxID=930991 RepID=A0A0D0CZF6_9AGAM|nr:hypothetical protein PAXRUDRAFT_156996 [Paxillus rubicundulus Ve08.2h10]
MQSGPHAGLADLISSHRSYRVVLDPRLRSFADSCSLRELLQAQKGLHDAGILHRETCPANLRLGEDGGYLVDWDLSEVNKANFHDRRVSRIVGVITEGCQAQHFALDSCARVGGSTSTCDWSGGFKRTSSHVPALFQNFCRISTTNTENDHCIMQHAVSALFSLCPRPELGVCALIRIKMTPPR